MHPILYVSVIQSAYVRWIIMVLDVILFDHHVIQNTVSMGVNVYRVMNVAELFIRMNQHVFVRSDMPEIDVNVDRVESIYHFTIN